LSRIARADGIVANRSPRCPSVQFAGAALHAGPMPPQSAISAASTVAAPRIDIFRMPLQSYKCSSKRLSSNAGDSTRRRQRWNWCFC